MKILITGAGGFIGKYLAESLLADNHEVIAIYRNTKPIIQSASSHIRFEKLDLSKSLQRIEPVDVVIHTAAHTHLIPNSTAYDYVQANVMGMLNLTNYMKAFRPRIFIYFSTLSVYGEVNVKELDEETPLNKPEIYGLSKYMGELILKEFVDWFPSICIRLPGVVGPGYFTPWLGKVLSKALKNEAIMIYNPDSMFNNVVDLIELKRFISLIIESGFVGSDSVNLAASEPIQVQEVLDLIISLTSSKSKIITQNTSKQSFSIKIEKFKKLFGFKPVTTKEIVSRYVAENMIM